jgi:hypothetical protein
MSVCFLKGDGTRDGIQLLSVHDRYQTVPLYVDTPTYIVPRVTVNIGVIQGGLKVHIVRMHVLPAFDDLSR